MSKPADFYLSNLYKPEHLSSWPQNFPPPDDWILSFDWSGKALSLFGHDFWDFRAYKNGTTFNFERRNFSEVNKSIVKNGLFLALFHPGLFPGNFRSTKYCFYCLVRMADVCDKHGIPITSLNRFPKVQSDVAESFQGSNFKQYISFLHRLRVIGAEHNFDIINDRTLANIASHAQNWEGMQTPYIPPRIWNYQLSRLNELLDDFLVNQNSIEAAFDWLTTAYQKNSTAKTIPRRYYGPFLTTPNYRALKVNFGSNFSSFLDHFNLKVLFSKWLDENRLNNVKSFTRFLNMLRDASILYILNFSLQRNSEACSLHSDCYKTEYDEHLGEVAMIAGVTTKTEEDSDARWVVPTTVNKAIKISSWIAKKRYGLATLKSGYTDSSLPLTMCATEPWSAYHPNYEVREIKARSHIRFQGFIEAYPKVISLDEITVSNADWKIALSLTPSLRLNPDFSVGSPWLFATHQLRRTTCVNMFSSSMVSDSSLQYQLKHFSRNMTLYYGRNSLNLRLNSETETSVIVESYNAIYRRVIDIVTNKEDNVRPHKKETISKQIIHLVEEKEEKALLALIKKGGVGCRPTLLGYCMNSGPCSYGGIESLSKCVSGDGGGICGDAIFARQNESELKSLRIAHEKTLLAVEKGSPLSSAIKQEIYAIGVYLDVIQR